MTNFASIFFSWVCFYALHSALASDKAKAWARRSAGVIHSNYRLIYNAVSLVLLVLLLNDLTRRGGNPLFATDIFVQTAGVMVWMAGLVILIVSFRNYDFAEFAGFRLPEWRQPLRISGLNARVRHPIYSGTLLFLLGLWLLRPTLNFLALLSATIVYLPWGIYWEEKKLLRQYGDAYAAYQKRVKRLIPGLW